MLATLRQATLWIDFYGESASFNPMSLSQAASYRQMYLAFFGGGGAMQGSSCTTRQSKMDCVLMWSVDLVYRS